MAKAKKTKAILCVDDDHIILGSLKIQLMQEFNDEFIIETAESGDEALEILDFLTERSIHTLVIITDWLMPEMKGDELLVEVHKQFPKVGKIMQSNTHLRKETCSFSYLSLGIKKNLSKRFTNQ